MSDLLYFNGINGATGTYGLAPMTGEELSDRIAGTGEQEGIGERNPANRAELEARRKQDRIETILAEKTALEAQRAAKDPEADAEEIAELETRLKELKEEEDTLRHLGVKEGVDPTDLAQAGWAAIFPAAKARSEKAETIAAIKEALSDLLALRQEQAGDLYGIYNHKKKERQDGAYRPGETAREFLARYDVRPSDPAQPEKVPYYLLLVGSPQDIPFSFQYQLDVQYAVGRIDFGDNLDAYRNYASSIVAVEKGKLTLERRATFFGVANPDDQATNLSADHLVQPLYKSLESGYPRWKMDTILREKATKERLLRLIKGEGREAPTLLFTASHGMEFPLDDLKKRQVPHQGALLCADWPGPNAWRGGIPQDHYLAGEDLTGDINLLGMIAFFFACYGAGTPLYDEFTKQAFKKRGQIIAEHPFVAALPKAMLSLPQGGALAVIGHVERAWGSSFLSPRKSEQITVFEGAIERLLEGHPVGSAMEYFNARYAALSAALTNFLGEIDNPDYRYDPYELAELWTENNDARGYIVLGDPAVRLPVAQAGVPATGRRVLGGKPVVVADMYLSIPQEELKKPAGAPFEDADWYLTPLSVKKYVEQVSQQSLSDRREPTAVTPHLETPIVTGENLVYCASFQIAWDQLSDDILEEALKLEDDFSGEEPRTAQALNKRLVGKQDIAPDCYLAMAGRGHEGIVERVERAMKEKFDRTPELDITLDDPNGILAYAFLEKSLPFDQEFEVLEEPLIFSDGVAVQSFGIKEDDTAADQVVILDYRHPDDFIIRLQRSAKIDEMIDWGDIAEPPHRITDDVILAKVTPRATLLDTLNTVLLRTSEKARARARETAARAGEDPNKLLSPQLGLDKKEALQIPKIEFNVQQRYTELEYVSWLNEGFEEYVIAKALQAIKFKLDETGAVLSSEAAIEAFLGSIQPRQFIFDKPFLLYFKEKEAQYPYLALWIANSELLVKAQAL